MADLPGMGKLCGCSSCRTARERARGRCDCCGGAGVVLSITEEHRPCSRCRPFDFDAWARDRAKRKPKAVT